MSILVRVALPVPLYKTFDYIFRLSLLNDEQPSKEHRIKEHPIKKYSIKDQLIGCRVQVPFGRQKLIGIITEVPSQSTVEKTKLKSVVQLIDSNPVLGTTEIELAAFLSGYYHYPFGDTLSTMLPAKLRQGDLLTLTQTYWQVCDSAGVEQIAKNAHKQKQNFELVAVDECGIAEQKLLSQGADKPTLKKLAEKKLIFCDERAFQKVSPKLKQPALNLNQEQQAAFDAIINSLGGYAGFLLAGVTGSGKTEVYLQLIEKIICQGKQALVLVPEIGLTSQTLKRFNDRFEAHIVTLHSHMNDTERKQAWAHVKSGSAQIVIGTRLSVLAPFTNLGLIIVDEAHDTSYKQQSSLRYHARDVAMWRAHKASCLIVLGSATPSFESLQRVAEGKLTQLNLTQRAANAKPPQFKILDARGQSLDSKLSQKAIDAMRHTLDKGEQVLVFLNRRGYAPALLCDGCGETLDCPRCDAHLTLHHKPYTQLICHHCNWRQKPPKACPVCASDNLHAIGVGTEKLEEALQAHFADTPILRVDADSTRKKGDWQRIYDAINKREPCILLGTQMLAKGHHFEHVTLVVMPNVDRGFLSSDFRAPERVAQLITQVAGRAGRGKHTGTVLIQSLQPDNPLLLSLVQGGYMAFAEQGLTERKLLKLSPFSHAALVRVDSSKPERTKKALEQIAAHMSDNQLTLWGPLTAPMEKVQNRFFGHLLILSASRSYLQNTLSNRWENILTAEALKYCRVSLDIDPVEW